MAFFFFLRALRVRAKSKDQKGERVREIVPFQPPTWLLTGMLLFFSGDEQTGAEAAEYRKVNEGNFF